MKTRELACVYYLYEGGCAKNHKGTFCYACQTCKDYVPKKGSAPRRKDLRKEKNEKWMKNIKNFS